tara:strand:+ start:1422 stop:3281 length:1860 start_codon:yes stop_codon:yes gene_type:complete
MGMTGISLSFVDAHADILGLRTGKHPEKTRLVVELSYPDTPSVVFEEDPTRVTLELANSPLNAVVNEQQLRNMAVGVVKKVELVPGDDKATRLTLQFRQPARLVHQFTLPPNANPYHRLVLDFSTADAGEWAALVGHKAVVEQKGHEVASLPHHHSSAVAANGHAVDQVEPSLPTNEAPVAILSEDDKAKENEVFPDRTTTEQAPRQLVMDDRVANDDGYIPAGDNFGDAYFSSLADEPTDEGVSVEFSGYVEGEFRYFYQSSNLPGVKKVHGSLAAEPSLEVLWNEGKTQFIATAFGRVDFRDNERSHVDLREFKLVHVWDNLTVTAGVDSVFWGVTESHHLVDILNQDDLLEDIDQEDKLGQPMISAAYQTEFGVFSAYVMTYFRQKEYAGLKGRPRLAMEVDTDQTIYESNDEEWHVDWAARWSHVIGNVDVGLYHFRGTNRDLTFVAGFDGLTPVLIPRYATIGQTGLDVQATIGALLVKGEAIYQTGDVEKFFAGVGGFEYTFYGLGGGESDLGILLEYLYDERGENGFSPFEDDIFAGLRWTANDVDDTTLLVGGIFDLDSKSKLVNVEASRRFGNYWKVSLDARLFLTMGAGDPLFPFNRDDFLQLRVARYF